MRPKAEERYDLAEVTDKLLNDYPVELMYITGSYVNGYYTKDSDIDIVAVTRAGSSNTPLKLSPNFSMHLISPLTLKMYESAQPYAYTRMVPLYNTEACMEVSDWVKSELVRRQLIRFKNNGKRVVDVTDPIKNDLMNQACQRPWRTAPVKRMFKSEDTSRILAEEYQRTFDILENKGMLQRSGQSYMINPDYMFDEGFDEQRPSIIFTMKESAFGWHYLKNLGYLIKNASNKY